MKKSALAIDTGAALAVSETAEMLDLALANLGLAPVATQATKEAAAILMMREALSDVFMDAHVMPLMGDPSGFGTDADKRKESGKWVRGPGLSKEEVRPALISHLRKGGSWTGGELVIIGGKDYQTKEFCARKLDALLGQGCWRLAVTSQCKSGAVSARVEVVATWKADDWKPHKLAFEVASHQAAGPDQIAGKGKRKAMAWLLAHAGGVEVELVDGDVIDVGPPSVSGGGGKDESGRRKVEARKVTPAVAAGDITAPQPKPKATLKKRGPAPSAPVAAGKVSARAQEIMKEPKVDTHAFIAALKTAIPASDPIGLATEFCQAQGWLRNPGWTVKSLGAKKKREILADMPAFVAAIAKWERAESLGE